MAKTVLILRWGASAYDSLGGLLELMADQFRAEGLDVAVFAADGPDWPNRLAKRVGEGGIAFALTMSGIASDLGTDGKLIWETAKVPLFNWNCDHPCYFPTRHGIRSPYLLHAYVFADHARYNILHLNPNGAAFAVHLGIPPRSLFGAAVPVRPSGRNGRIMFSKTGADTNAIEAAWRSYIPDVQRLVFAAAEELFSKNTGDFLPTLQSLAEPLGLLFGGNSRLTMLLIRELDGYVRFRRANLVMQTVRRLPVDVFGSGWEHIDWHGAAATYRGPLTWRAMIERLPLYSGCLSTNPLVEQSVHDRSFFALAAGVTPISDDNLFARTTMPGLAPYRFGFTSERITQALEAALAAPAEAIDRTEEAWNAMSVCFGMRRSAQQIVQFAMLHSHNAPFGR
jgi:hypothetical protein